MSSGLTIIERAFQLARTGDFTGAAEIREQLRREGFANPSAHVSGPVLVKQLRDLCQTARSGRAPEHDQRRD